MRAYLCAARGKRDRNQKPCNTLVFSWSLMSEDHSDLLCREPKRRNIEVVHEFKCSVASLRDDVPAVHDLGIVVSGFLELPDDPGL